MPLALVVVRWAYEEHLLMPTFSLFGKSVELQATPEPTARTRDESAWLHRRYLTVRLIARMEALRVHTAGRAFAGREASQEAGAWILIGDVVQSSSQLASSRALPSANPRSFVAFTHVSEAVLAAGTVLNIGIASAKFGGAGGEFQAEYVTGPPMTFRPLVGKHWHGAVGRA
jgi:hypothetical protein